MAKIKVRNPVVEMDGDEMSRVIWQRLKDKLIHPYLDIDLVYYDLGVENRDKTRDQVTVDAAEMIRQVGVDGVKCATITPGRGARRRNSISRRCAPFAQRHHPQHPGRHHLPRADHLQERAAPGAGLDQADHHWPPRLSADQYRATDFKVPWQGHHHALTFTGEDGKKIELRGVRSPGAGVTMAMYNVDESIRGFARASIHYAPQHAATRCTSRPRTPSPQGQYDGRFMDTSSRTCSTRSSRPSSPRRRRSPTSTA